MAFAVVGGLFGDGGERGALRLGFDYAEREAVDEEKVIAATEGEENFTKGNAASRGGFDGHIVLHGRTCCDEVLVDSAVGGGVGEHGRRATNEIRPRVTERGETWTF